MPVAVFAVLVVGACRWIVRRHGAREAGPGAAAVPRVHVRPRGHRSASTSKKCPSDRLVYGAIDGMLKTLDPHSSFFDPKQYAQMRERQEGRYYGLGISIQVIDGDITVMSLFEGSPAYRAGIRRGDVIARSKARSTPARRRCSTPRAGRAIRRCEAQRPEGDEGQHLDPPPRLRQADRHGRRARRGEHHHGARRVHDRQRRPATSSWVISRKRPTAKWATRSRS